MPKLAIYRAKHESAAANSSSSTSSASSTSSTSYTSSTSILHIDMDAFFVSVELLDLSLIHI